MREIRVIEPMIFQDTAKLRVCAYARVSSDSEDQKNSFASQVNYYTKYIQAHDDWTFVDIYADQGIPIIIRLLSQGIFFRKFSWRLQGAAAKERFPAEERSQIKENIPANTHYRREPFVVNAAPCIAEPCGSKGTGQRKMSGDV